MSNPEAWRVALGCTWRPTGSASPRGSGPRFDDPLRYVTDFAATIPNASPRSRLTISPDRPSEIDVINGQVVELSRELGLETPYNETLCAILRDRESRFT